MKKQLRFVLSVLAFAAASAGGGAFAAEPVVIRADECKAKGPTVIDRIVAVVEAVKAEQARNTGAVVRIEPFAADPVANRELLFFRDNAKILWSDPKAKTPDYEEGSHLWRTEGKDRRRWWYERMKEKRGQVLASDGVFDVVMMGDSITHMMDREPGCHVMAGFRETFKSLNLGYGGDHAETLLWRAKNGELDGYRAKVVTVMIGTNNQGQKDTVETTASAIREALAVIREKQPQATVLLMRTFPRLAPKLAHMRARSALAVSRELEKLADGERVIWCDFNSLWQHSDGTGRFDLLLDGTHPGPAGIVTWLKALMPYFEKFTGKRYDFPAAPAAPCVRKWIAGRADFADETAVFALRDVAVRAATVGYNGFCLVVEGDRSAWDEKAKTRYDVTLAVLREAGLELVPMEGKTPAQLGVYVLDMERKRYDGLIELSGSFTYKPELWNDGKGGFVYWTEKGDYGLMGDAVRAVETRCLGK